MLVKDLVQIVKHHLAFRLALDSRQTLPTSESKLRDLSMLEKLLRGMDLGL